mmetsp:Transcript_3297/g.11897  ORF Transcript_3297/g.11897 Transcript_3297/m.11897 type:complete len:282 (+) Transcript_3297:615-1460(+)
MRVGTIVAPNDCITRAVSSHTSYASCVSSRTAYSSGIPTRTPRRGASSKASIRPETTSRANASTSAQRSTLVASSSSSPCIAASTTAASPTVRASTPTVSNELQYAINPNLDTRPYVGFNPTTPQYAAGNRTDPPVSLPSAKNADPFATAAALPALDPPAVRAPSDDVGFNVAPRVDVVPELPMPNSSMFVVPMSTAPERSRNSRTAVASYTGTCPRSIALPHVVSTPATQRFSLTANGTPSSADASSPPPLALAPASPPSDARRRASDARASRTARCHID